MPKAIISVYDKIGLIPFARGLVELGWTLIASGGTAQLLSNNNLPVTEVAKYTGSPEILDGRVKTLHPLIYGGLLARPNASDHAEMLKLGWDYIDLAAVNLYPFEETIARPDVTIEEAIENIDIGGVTLIRAAAKNHARVTLVCDPDDYPAVLAELQAGGVRPETRHHLAIKGFTNTSHYDSAITRYLSNPSAPNSFEQTLSLKLFPVSTLRYGENPHQNATLYSFAPNAGPLGGQVLQGKALSYNNLLDLDAAWRTVVSFEQPTIVIVKHLSPCGIASSTKVAEAFPLALASDPISAFGGVIAANQPFDCETAGAIGDLFVECIIAPGFTDEALQELAPRKNLRLVAMPDTQLKQIFDLRSVNHGVLYQSVDLGDPPGTYWHTVTKRAPSEDEMATLRFAWKACQHVKSNAIVFARGQATVGIGGGQPNRVDCVRIAAIRAGKQAHGAVMASDAFFPFPDSIEEAGKAGITAIISPGGSIHDNEAIAAADVHNIAMLFTGVRHFRH